MPKSYQMLYDWVMEQGYKITNYYVKDEILYVTAEGDNSIMHFKMTNDDKDCIDWFLANNNGLVGIRWPQRWL